MPPSLSQDPSCEDFISSSRYESFKIFDVVYKVIGDVELTTSILIPKGLKSRTCPLLVHFHGGGLIVGDKLWPEWFAMWFLQFGHYSNAIMLSPNYRLLPESNGHDILQDTRDFWIWVHGSLPAELTKLGLGIEVDLEKIAAGGESAGGYLALQSILHFPSAKVKAVISQYGVMDLAHPSYAHACTPQHITPSTVDDYLFKTANTTRTQSHPLATWFLVAAIMAEGRHAEFLVGTNGTDKEEFSLFPQKALASFKSKGGKLPAIWFMHGAQDDVLPVQCTRDFVKAVREGFPDADVFETERDGGHGFDVELEMGEVGQEWIREGCAFIERAWWK